MKKMCMIPGDDLIRVRVCTVFAVIPGTKKGCIPGVGMEGAAYPNGEKNVKA
jgi:hypothetical protein